MNEPPTLTPANALFAGSENDMLCLTLDGSTTHRRVSIIPMFPVSCPRRLLSAQNNEEEEIGIIEDLATFPREIQRLIENEMKHRYFVPRIVEIRKIEEQSGFYLWDTMTERGPRAFQVKGRVENVIQRDEEPYRLFITDIEDCKYEICDCRELPRSSLRILREVIL
ncbi:MAG: DUF1854 domain-containing protein [Lentisphaerae bacterium]|nr:DUF1854 domain-containing protein [Lentisphaerota bacterium]